MCAGFHSTDRFNESRIFHPRHWEALAQLLGLSVNSSSEKSGLGERSEGCRPANGTKEPTSGLLGHTISSI
jgi:hypothetical protein